MLPISYQMPAAVVVAVVGLMACVAGFRLLRYVLAAFGFFAVLILERLALML